jgi:Tol biopolymer transport system component
MRTALAYQPCLALAVCLYATALPCAAAPITLRVQGAAEPNGMSSAPAVSADANTVVFRSSASNLVPGQGTSSLFAWDRASGAITSLAPTANGNLYYPAVSSNGRYVAFETTANNLAPGADSQFSDVLRLDRQTGLFMRASQGLNATAANGGSDSAAISGDGRYVAFNSAASNLVIGGTTPGREHIYLMDMDSGQIELASRSSTGAEGNQDALAMESNAMSIDGTRLVFATAAENLAPVFNGNVSDVIVRRRDPQTGAISFENVNRSVAGAVGTRSSSRGSISSNGRYVVFVSSADNIHPAGVSPSTLFVRDLSANQLHPVARPAGYQTCTRARVNDLGEVAMMCAPQAPATALQLFRVALGSSAPVLVSASASGLPGNASSAQSFTISADGRVLAMESNASNLIAADTNGAADVFVVAEPSVLFGLFADGFE